MKVKLMRFIKKSAEKSPGIFLALVGSVGLFFGMGLADLKHGGVGITILPAVLLAGLLGVFVRES